MTDYQHKYRHAAREIEDWLRDFHRGPIDELMPLRGGYWSTAWAYEFEGDPLVLRLGVDDEGYRIDGAAHDLAGHRIPIPEVIHVGRAFDGAAAISRRHFGTFLEEADDNGQDDVVGQPLGELLAAFRRVEPGPAVEWYCTTIGSAPTAADWRTWLRDRMQIPADVSGRWRIAVRENPELQAVFDEAVRQADELIDVCPERRDLIHNDLLHQNVLVDGGSVSAVFSWKLSAVGDFLYDVAACSLWGRWFPAIESAHIWERTLRADDLSEQALDDAPRRHHCYQLNIAAGHLVWFVQSNDDINLGKLLDHTADLLEHGPNRG